MKKYTQKLSYLTNPTKSDNTNKIIVSQGWRNLVHQNYQIKKLKKEHSKYLKINKYIKS